MKYNNKDVTEIIYNGKIVQTWVHNGVEVHNTATGFEFSFNSSSSSYTVTNYTSQDSGKEIKIPSTYRGYPVTKIAPGAFSSDSIKGITIPASITNIVTGYGFSGSNIEYINVDNNNPLYSSQDGVLYNKDKTRLIDYPNGKADTHFSVPDGVTAIGSYGFSNSEFITVTLPNTLKTLEEGSFNNCYRLSEITIPDSVTFISRYSFNSCYALKKITLSKNIQKIHDGTFTSTLIEEITIPEKVDYVSEKAFVSCEKLTSIKVDDKNTTYSSRVGNLASKDGSILYIFAPGKSGEVTFPISIRTIKKYAFYVCPNITKINIGLLITSIEEAAFYDCESLQSFEVVASEHYLSDGGVLYDKLKTLLIKYPANREGTSYNAHSKRIGESSFYGCKNLNNLILGTNVESIGNSVARDCSSLVYLHIVSLKESTIENYAFADCENLIYLWLGIGIKYIEDYAFDLCNRLGAIYYQGSANDWNNILIESHNTPLSNATKIYDHNVLE